MPSFNNNPASVLKITSGVRISRKRLFVNTLAAMKVGTRKTLAIKSRSSSLNFLAIYRKQTLSFLTKLTSPRVLNVTPGMRQKLPFDLKFRIAKVTKVLDNLDKQKRIPFKRSNVNFLKQKYSTNFTLSVNFQKPHYNFFNENLRIFTNLNTSVVRCIPTPRDNFFGVNLWGEYGYRYMSLVNLFKHYKTATHGFININNFTSNKSMFLKNYFLLNTIKSFSNSNDEGCKLNNSLFIFFNRSKNSIKPLGTVKKRFNTPVIKRTAGVQHKIKVRRKGVRKVNRRSIRRERYSSYMYLTYQISQNLNKRLFYKKHITKKYYKFVRYYTRKPTKFTRLQKNLNGFFLYLKNYGNVSRLLRAKLLTSKIKNLKSYYISDTEFFNPYLIKITDKSPFVPKLSTKKKKVGLEYTGFSENSLYDLLLLRKNDNAFESHIGLQSIINVRKDLSVNAELLSNFYSQNYSRDRLYGLTKNALFVKSDSLTLKKTNSPLKPKKLKLLKALKRYKQGRLNPIPRYLGMTWVTQLVNLHFFTSSLIRLVWHKRSSGAYQSDPTSRLNDIKLLFYDTFTEILATVHVIKPLLNTEPSQKDKKLLSIIANLKQAFNKYNELTDLKKNRKFFLMLLKMLRDITYRISKLITKKTLKEKLSSYTKKAGRDKRFKKKVLKYENKLKLKRIHTFSGLYYTVARRLGVAECLKYTNNRVYRQMVSRKQKLKQLFTLIENNSFNYNVTTVLEERYLKGKVKLKKRQMKVVKKRASVANRLDFIRFSVKRKLKRSRYLNTIRLSFFNGYNHPSPNPIVPANLRIRDYTSKQLYLPSLLKNIFFLPTVLKSTLLVK